MEKQMFIRSFDYDCR